MVDKFQTKEGAQEALQSLNIHQERAPSALKNTQGILSLEFEAILTPQLQVFITNPQMREPETPDDFFFLLFLCSHRSQWSLRS